MSLDPYALCPCGSKKKIKFCCSKDILADLEKLSRMVEAEQRVAALDLANRLIARHGERDALLWFKMILQWMLRHQDFQATLARLLERMPHNPQALALAAIDAANAASIERGVELLQAALDHSGDQVPPMVYTAVGHLARLLMLGRNIPAARAHFILQVELSGGEDEAPIDALIEIGRSPEVPLALKQSLVFEEAPAEAPYREAYFRVQRHAAVGSWNRALAALAPLLEKYPHEAVLLKAKAVLECCLGRLKAATQTLTQYAELGDAVDFDHAVEALVVALQLDPGDDLQANIYRVNTVMPVSDPDKLVERFQGLPRIIEDDVSQYRPKEGPPPRSAFLVLDRPQPADGEPWTADSTPQLLCEILLFGKETDREARVEVILPRDERYEATLADLRALADGLLGEPVGEPKVVNWITGEVAGIRLFLMISEAVSATDRLQIETERIRRGLMNEWVNRPLVILGGKSPREAAGDPALRVRLAAAVRTVELACGTAGLEIDFAPLRAELGVPQPTAPDPARTDYTRVSLLRMDYIDPAVLSDEQLTAAYRHAVFHRHGPAIRRLTPHVLSRESLRSEIPRSSLLAALADVTPNSDEALRLIVEAQEAVQQEGGSPAMFRLRELELRFHRGEGEKFRDLLYSIEKLHGKEPGVNKAIFELLVDFGFLREDGTLRIADEAERAHHAAPPPSASLWTPDQTEVRSGQEGAKLWVPGD